MAKTKEISKAKKSFLQYCEDSLNNENLLVFCEYNGLSVTELQSLRSKVKASNGISKVVKNNVAKKAFVALDDIPEHLFKNSTLLATSNTDNIGPVLKQISEFSKDHEGLKIKGGYLDKAYIDPTYIKTLASLPTKDVLIAKLLMLVKSPISRLALTLSTPINKLNLTLSAIRQNKEEEK